MASSTPTNQSRPGNVIGPLLPPGFNLGHGNSVESYSNAGSSDQADEDASLNVQDNSLGEEGVTNIYGPSLPPGFLSKPAEKPVIGAALPPGMTKASFGSHLNDDSMSSGCDEIIGPLPPSSSQHSNNDIHEDFERRALKMKRKLTSCPDEELKREEWMTVLPPELVKNFGLGPRSFLRKTPRAAGDRSVWTDTPLQKLEREQKSGVVDEREEEPFGNTSKDDLHDLIQINYDEKMSKKAEELNKSGKRVKSLMEIHQKKLKQRKKEEKEKPKERKPFDRDVDLKVNMIDDAKRKALVKQSRQLNDKFSHGKGQFL